MTPSDDLEVRDILATARPFEDYIQTLRNHSRRFQDHYARLAFIKTAEIASTLFCGLDVLVLTEDWCPDSVLNVPLVARLVEASQANLRIGDRSAHQALAKRFPGRGGASRLPTVIVIGPQGVAHWSERSASAHAWMRDFTLTDPLPDIELKDGHCYVLKSEICRARSALNFLKRLQDVAQVRNDENGAHDQRPTNQQHGPGGLIHCAVALPFAACVGSRPCAVRKL